MATTINTDMKVYDPRIQGGYIERLTQNVEAFNGQTNGAIRLISNRKAGNFDYEAFLRLTPGLVTPRDPLSLAPVAGIKIVQGEMIGVKINRKIGPVESTLDAFRKAGLSTDDGALQVTIGAQVANAVTTDMLNTGIRGIRAALNNQPLVKHTVATAGTLQTTSLVDGIAKFGDASSRVVAWVMHSKTYFDLIKEQIAAKLPNFEGILVAGGSPASLNRPILVTDSDDLIVTGAPNDYYTLGLTADALNMEETEEEIIRSDLITGLENLVMRVQGEYAYNMRLKGFSWDVANGGFSPGNTALATGTNWDAVMASHKDFAGCIIQSK